MMFLKLNIAALLLPLALPFFIMSNIFSRASQSENNFIVEQNRAEQNGMSGTWSINIPGGATTARLQLRRGDESLSIHVPLAQLQGLDASAAGTSQAGFQLARDAGTFTFTGSFQNGRGSGQWTFKGNSDFVSNVRKHGYDHLTEEDLFRLVLNNISASYIAELAQAGYRNLPVSTLNALYSNGIRTGYITGLAATGYAKLSPSDLLALKTNGVTETYIKSLQARGYKNLSVQEILSIRTNSSN